jgi:hypothetical protein
VFVKHSAELIDSYGSDSVILLLARTARFYLLSEPEKSVGFVKACVKYGSMATSMHAASGGLLLKTDDAGVSEVSGLLVLSTGSSGALYVGPGSAASGRAGAVYVNVGSGNSGNGGELYLVAGSSSYSTGGRLSLVGGYGSISTRGAVLLRSADAGNSGESGMLELSTGTSSKGNRGALYIGSGRHL